MPRTKRTYGVVKLSAKSARRPAGPEGPAAAPDRTAAPTQRAAPHIIVAGGGNCTPCCVPLDDLKEVQLLQWGMSGPIATEKKLLGVCAQEEYPHLRRSFAMMPPAWAAVHHVAIFLAQDGGTSVPHCDTVPFAELHVEARALVSGRRHTLLADVIRGLPERAAVIATIHIMPHVEAVGSPPEPVNREQLP